MKELTKQQLKAAFPHYKDNFYRGINTSIGVHTYVYGRNLGSMENLEQAMFETCRSYRILDQKVTLYLPNTGVRRVEVTYEVLE